MSGRLQRMWFGKLTCPLFIEGTKSNPVLLSRLSDQDSCHRFASSSPGTRFCVRLLVRQTQPHCWRMQGGSRQLCHHADAHKLRPTQRQEAEKNSAVRRRGTVRPCWAARGRDQAAISPAAAQRPRPAGRRGPGRPTGSGSCPCRWGPGRT